ncbi:hypothetical protein QBZ16_001383 [Prototheca wickerhamii]|uniref:Hikeshi-like C-terminal domain-containing protein n=1 Tax=Prototheca wickerhamii TaxID=3111 RepID=A0AAD9IH55_PROWI|nr:hypothetical protein QBZ16_001383 [Prototheca wickerhamii]
MSSGFGIFFVGCTCPIPHTAFAQTDSNHWVLDATSLIATGHLDLKEVAFFLTQPNSLPPNVALSIFVSTGGCDWSYRGCISNEHPSDVFPLSWPEIAPGTVVGAGYAQIGILAESLEEARQKEGSKLGAKEDFAKRVGLDLFNFMQSFGGVQNVGGNNILVPVNVLDAWYQRLERRLRRDPDFLTRQKDKI